MRTICVVVGVVGVVGLLSVNLLTQGLPTQKMLTIDVAQTV